jgi:hypothetical protein
LKALSVFGGHINGNNKAEEISSALEQGDKTPALWTLTHLHCGTTDATPATVDVTIGGLVTGRLELDACTPYRFAYADKTFVSLLNLRFHEVRLDAVAWRLEDVRIVSASIFSSDLRRHICSSQWRLPHVGDRCGVFASGMYLENHIADDTSWPTLPVFRERRSWRWFLRESRVFRERRSCTSWS